MHPDAHQVPLEKGYSQVDWLRVSKSGADLTGTGRAAGAGLRRDIRMEEVAKHNTAEDAWMVLRGKASGQTGRRRADGGTDPCLLAA